ncbi:Formylmethanofuran--tetrahydromethanopterin N-formyltransferase [Planctomycetales bacterium 10988]|nr:Formylmethanofuran--tetrahydromethanopterin N-formyltransferase [Planctomycetales bacterium 10988]
MKQINGTTIEDTFAEAFPMTAARVIVTALNEHWAKVAAQVATGYATSVIGCDCEAGIEQTIPAEHSPDGRPGVSLLFFGMAREKLEKALINRVGQTLLTCPTTACYDGLPRDTPGIDPKKRIQVGSQLRYFGDSFQTSKKLADRRFWRIPIMEGEFTCEDSLGTLKGVGGGNFLLLGKNQAETLHAAERAVAAIAELPEVILPFPGGIVGSGSKVGSKYPQLFASTNEAYCPTLRGLVESKLPSEVHCVYEIVLDGLSPEAISHAMKIGIEAACQTDLIAISAGNYGGKLGPHHFHLHELWKTEKE